MSSLVSGYWTGLIVEEDWCNSNARVWVVARETLEALE